ncbi:Zn(2)-C6 fungal-type DNA-binding domain protein [Cordyceps fumosorosea ARSEF 2679]|uniref:Zn(2)-C6 fungal-type DNA-binding domain protein n=1 Tax=Cordyceps fumosorosea (strain ARSEF 2679) TaxID=1081104 RepID=A0A168DBD4_CORFA|nr:Zn(2)-C6 fungal-type DNA-binding domain protein [Cordyceps fumosorosea ARSEF 2679]OAA72395.1 Zn(2)-C6 fungal-type DNA-binding domain protein [Cordyceps fumosorosea ARSEF 2679]
MAAACSYPPYPPPQSWDVGDRPSLTRGKNDAVLASHGSRNGSDPSRGVGDQQLRHRHHHQQHSHHPPGRRRSREMDEVPALGHVVQENKFRQGKPSEGGRPAGTFGMLARQRVEPAPILKRSFSTPAVHTMVQDSAATTAAGEKKRNKLGYHRTSIACNHCRRRKIRCIVSANIQNRCENCIRLKKDCSFCPVDQQQPPTGDSQGGGGGGSIGGQGTGSTHSQSSSPALAPGNPPGIASGSIFSTGPGAQDPAGLAAGPVLMPSSVGYATITGGEEMGLSIPNHHPEQQQSFSVSPRSSFTWASAEPSPIALPGSMEMTYGWHQFGNEPAAAAAAAAEQAAPFGPDSAAATQSAWMATTEAAQMHNWNWANGVSAAAPTAAQTRSVSFSNELIGQPQQPFVSAAGGVLYDGGVPSTAPMSLAPGPAHLPRQAGDPSGSWGAEQQQQMLQQQQRGHDNMGFEPWDVLHNNGPPPM